MGKVKRTGRTMRIVGGKHRGRRIDAPEGRDLRPTSDRARESVFNILEHGAPAVALEGAMVVDLFCGTGALGLEALSRGGAKTVLVDIAEEHLRLARRNAGAIGEVKNIVTLRLDCSRLPPPARVVGAPVDLVFLDPPYGSGLATPALQGLAAKGWLKPGAVAVVEVGAKEPFQAPRGYRVLDERVYGAARVVFVKFEPVL